jgi:hypothetical protein
MIVAISAATNRTAVQDSRFGDSNWGSPLLFIYYLFSNSALVVSCRVGGGAAHPGRFDPTALFKQLHEAISLITSRDPGCSILLP